MSPVSRGATIATPSLLSLVPVIGTQSLQASAGSSLPGDRRLIKTFRSSGLTATFQMKAPRWPRRNVKPLSEAERVPLTTVSPEPGSLDTLHRRRRPP